MSNTNEITSYNMFFDMAENYNGGDIPSVSKEIWKDIYTNKHLVNDQVFLINDVWGNDRERAYASSMRVAFFKQARQKTFRELPTEDKFSFLSEFRQAIQYCSYFSDRDKDFNSKLKNEAAKEFKEMFNTLQPNEKQQMITNMTSKEALLTKQFGEQYNISEFKRIDISTLNPEIFSDKTLQLDSLLYSASYLNLDEMDFLIKGTGYCGEEVLNKYINKAMAQAESGGAERALKLFKERKTNALGTSYNYTKDIPEMLLELAHTDPKVGSELLAEGFRLGYRAEPSSWGEPEDSIFGKFGKDPMLQEAQAKYKARVDFAKIAKGEKVALSADLLKYKEEHLDDILKMYQHNSQWGNNREDSDENVLKNAIKSDYLSDESRAKIATTLLNGNNINDNLKLLEICLEFACSAKHTGTIAFDALEKAMQARLTPAIKNIDKKQEEKSDANQKLKNLLKQQEAECLRTGIDKAIDITSNLQKAYKNVTDKDAKADKPYLPQEQAEILISRALKGEKVNIALIEEPKGMKALFTGSKEKNRVQEQNKRLELFEQTLGIVSSLARENGKDADKQEIKKINKPADRRNKLHLFETINTLLSHTGHLLEEETISDMKQQLPKKEKWSKNIYDDGLYKGDETIENAQYSVRFYDDWNVHIEYVSGIARQFKNFQTHRKETAKERTKEAKSRIALQANDALAEKAVNLKGLTDKKRISVAKKLMQEKARNR